MNAAKELIIDRAIEAVTNYIKSESLYIETLTSENSNTYYDGRVIITYRKQQKVYYNILVKKTISTLAQVINLEDQINENILIITEYVSESIAENLVKRKIQFIDTAGNIYIENDIFFIYVVGKPRPKYISKPVTSRAFSKTGLITNFHFLLEPDLVNYSYREISIKVGVSLGSLRWIFHDLRNEHFLIENNFKNKKLIHKKNLLEKWTYAYREKLRPSLFIGKYRFADKSYRLKFMNLLDDIPETFWGGEAAAEILENYLKAQELTLYTNRQEKEVVRKLKLIPDENGYIEMLQTFWNIDYFGNNNNIKRHIVPIILIYADLINSNNNRDLEEAKRIRTKYDL